ncbi:MAG: hypothetical protein HZC40_25425 [Chloroflexi bacterium]|nr:hypothetical protein [Chloroflexota bacterium]
MKELNKLIALIALGLITLIAGCGEIASSPSATPTKVIPIFKPIPTSTPYQRPTLVPRTDLADNQVEVDDPFFFPAIITVTVGTTVHWLQVGDVAHNIESVDRAWGTPSLSSGGTFAYTFNSIGVYNYVCTFHAPGMRGTVYVIHK